MKSLLYSIIPREMFITAALFGFYGFITVFFFAAMLAPFALGIILCEPQPPSP